MKWSNNYKIGIPAIDAQHKRLFGYIAELDELLRQGLVYSDINRLLSNLEQYKTRHFQLEERIMEESGYPEIQVQKQAHAAFSNRLREIQSELKSKGLKPALVKTIKTELSSWLKDHVTGIDMKFGTYHESYQNSKKGTEDPL